MALPDDDGSRNDGSGGGAPTTLSQILAMKGGARGAVVNVDEPMVKLVIVALDGDLFAFPGGSIREILPDSPVFFLPGCPPSMEGVLNVRGDIESVIRLRAVLRYPEAAPGAPSRILLGRGGGITSGLRVDGVEDVLDVPESAVHVPPHTLPDHLRGITRGVLVHHGRPVALLDLDRLFADYRAGLA